MNFKVLDEKTLYSMADFWVSNSIINVSQLGFVIALSSELKDELNVISIKVSITAKQENKISVYTAQKDILSKWSVFEIINSVNISEFAQILLEYFEKVYADFLKFAPAPLSLNLSKDSISLEIGKNVFLEHFAALKDYSDAELTLEQ